MSTPNIYSKSILLSLAFCLAWLANCSSVATGQEIQWLQNLDQAKAEAAKTNRLVWLHFAADWCVPCKKLDSFVFSDTGVIRTSDRNVVAVKIDVDQNDSLVRKLGVPRVPYDIVMTPAGETIINRPSPRNSSDYLKMFNRLDTPLQNLSSGNRESINAGISQIQGVLNKAGGGLRQKASDLDLEGPSHQMAATTVQGQRLERGLTSAERAAEIRAIEARLLKQKAEMFIAEEEQRSMKSQGPKVSDNPFFKGPDVSGSTASKDSTKFVSNRFIEQKEAVQTKSDETVSSFLPPNPPALANKIVEKVERQVEGAVEKNLSQFEESKEFSFPSLAGPEADKAAEKPNKPATQDTQPKLTLPKFSAPKLAELKQSLPAIPEFKERSEDKSKGGDFAYAPINELKKALQSTIKPEVAEPKLTDEKVAVAVDSNPLRSTVATKTPAVGSADLPRPVAKPASPVAKTRPPISTSFAVPQAPVTVEGVLQIAEPKLQAVEGQLVAAERPVDNDYRVRRQRATAIPQQFSQAERLLEQVNFFEQAKPAEPATQVTIVQPQPVQPPQVTIVQAQPVQPPPQVVINLNTGATTKPEPRNHGRIIQSGAVAEIAATTATANRARIKTPDVASAVRSKYALKGKCPVTLLTQGQWVDGKKEIGCVHRDRVYLFANAESREAFLANPDQLSPLLAGFDPVIFEETGKLIEGEESFGTFMGEAPNQRIVLFKTADTRDRFQKEPVKYLNIVRSAMTKNAQKDIKLR